VVGIDVLEQPQMAASLDRYFQADLDGGLGPAGGSMRGMRFDRILLLDVLEHLRYPTQLLADCQTCQALAANCSFRCRT
jgi:2-polyprenyl-3-methyl-5-hydroxy-6-metoxy-1,4-benzoquinol methylase